MSGRKEGVFSLAQLDETFFRLIKEGKRKRPETFHLVSARRGGLVTVIRRADIAEPEKVVVTVVGHNLQRER